MAGELRFANISRRIGSRGNETERVELTLLTAGGGQVRVAPLSQKQLRQIIRDAATYLEVTDD